VAQAPNRKRANATMACSISLVSCVSIGRNSTPSDGATAAGFVESLARPGGNATGFTNFEYGQRKMA
jgi:hypothetical protein